MCGKSLVLGGRNWYKNSKRFLEHTAKYPQNTILYYVDIQMAVLCRWKFWESEFYETLAGGTGCLGIVKGFPS